jgi:hypothetical protein
MTTMTTKTYEFRLAATVSVQEACDTLRLAVLAAEAVHGESDVAIDGGHHLDAASRTCRITADTPVGRDLLRLFAAFLRREFGPGAFRVLRVGPSRREATRSA